MTPFAVCLFPVARDMWFVQSSETLRSRTSSRAVTPSTASLTRTTSLSIAKKLFNAPLSVLPATWQRWYSRPYPRPKAGTRLSYSEVMQGWVDPGTAVRRSPCPSLHIAVAVAINTTVRGEIWISNPGLVTSQSDAINSMVTMVSCRWQQQQQQQPQQTLREL